MLRLLDTDDLAPADRARSVIDCLAVSSARCRISHLCHETSVWARFHSAQLSQTVEVLHFEGSPMRMTRRLVDTVEAPAQRVSFAVPGSAGGTLWQRGTRRLRADDLVLLDLAAPYDYRAGEGGRCSVQVDVAALGMSVTDIRAAAPHLTSSPLYGLVRDHVVTLAESSATADRSATVFTDLAAATTNLFTALLRSCVP